MNWDWDKLQEKRQRQSGQKPNDSGNKPEQDDDNNNDEQEEQRIRWSMNKGSQGNKGGGNSGMTPEELLAKLRNSRSPFWRVALLVLIVGWLASGIFIVDPDEVGMILRFGAYSRQVGPGPHYHFPYPIETVEIPKVSLLRTEEIGTRGAEEAAMLTGDENIVNVEFSVQYQVKDPFDFLYRVDLLSNRYRQSDTVRNSAIAAMRDVVAGNKIDLVLKEDRSQIETETQLLLQEILDSYGAGVIIKAVQMQPVHHPREVEDAVKDVTSAREDRSRSINEAEAYHNEIIPQTRGDAAEIVNQAEAYSAAVVRQAEGEAGRFLAMLAEYEKAPDITKKRMYIEAMEKILSAPGLEKIIMPKEGTQSIVPYLPLDRLQPKTSAAQGSK